MKDLGGTSISTEHDIQKRKRSVLDERAGSSAARRRSAGNKYQTRDAEAQMGGGGVDWVDVLCQSSTLPRFMDSSSFLGRKKGNPPFRSRETIGGRSLHERLKGCYSARPSAWERLAECNPDQHV